MFLLVHDHFKMLMCDKEMPKTTFHNLKCIKGHIAADNRLAKRVWFGEVEIRRGISCTAK